MRNFLWAFVSGEAKYCFGSFFRRSASTSRTLPGCAIPFSQQKAPNCRSGSPDTTPTVNIYRSPGFDAFSDRCLNPIHYCGCGDFQINYRKSMAVHRHFLYCSNLGDHWCIIIEFFYQSGRFSSASIKLMITRIPASISRSSLFWASVWLIAPGYSPANSRRGMTQYDRGNGLISVRSILFPAFQAIDHQ